MLWPARRVLIGGDCTDRVQPVCSIGAIYSFRTAYTHNGSASPTCRNSNTYSRPDRNPCANCNTYPNPG